MPSTAAPCPAVLGNRDRRRSPIGAVGGICWTRRTPMPRMFTTREGRRVCCAGRRCGRPGSWWGRNSSPPRRCPGCVAGAVWLLPALRGDAPTGRITWAPERPALGAGAPYVHEMGAERADAALGAGEGDPQLGHRGEVELRLDATEVQVRRSAAGREGGRSFRARRGRTRVPEPHSRRTIPAKATGADTARVHDPNGAGGTGSGIFAAVSVSAAGEP